MKILVSFSGGKDSQACLIQAFKQYGGCLLYTSDAADE